MRLLCNRRIIQLFSQCMKSPGPSVYIQKIYRGPWKSRFLAQPKVLEKLKNKNYSLLIMGQRASPRAKNQQTISRFSQIISGKSAVALTKLRHFSEVVSTFL